MNFPRNQHKTMISVWFQYTLFSTIVIFYMSYRHFVILRKLYSFHVLCVFKPTLLSDECLNFIKGPMKIIELKVNDLGKVILILSKILLSYSKNLNSHGSVKTRCVASTTIFSRTHCQQITPIELRYEVPFERWIL